MIRRALVLAVALLPAAAGEARAQAAELERMLDRLGSFWSMGEADSIAAYAARAGVSLDLDGGPVGPLGPRQAAAVLRRFVENRQTVWIRAGAARIVGGAPPRAFGELAWLARAKGTTVPERGTIFFALVLEPDGWRVTEIRLLP